MMDIFTNFLSIWLSYGHFSNIYFKICGKCHNCGAKVCHRSISRGNTSDVKMMEMDLSVSPDKTKTETTTEIESSSDSNPTQISFQIV